MNIFTPKPVFLLVAKSKQRDMEDILFDVDSEGSTLLHLAAESENSEVGNIFKTIANSPSKHGTRLDVLNCVCLR